MSTARMRSVVESKVIIPKPAETRIAWRALTAWHSWKVHVASLGQRHIWTSAVPLIPARVKDHNPAAGTKTLRLLGSLFYCGDQLIDDVV